MEIIAEHGQLLLILACCFGLFMAWGVGANDVANAMGTSVGSRAITIKQAIGIAMVFEFMGAYLAGGEVTSTIRKGIIDPAVMAGTPELLVYGMLSALLAAAIWLLLASMMGWPVSTTHSIVGAIVGFAAVGISPDIVDWGKVGFHCRQLGGVSRVGRNHILPAVHQCKKVDPGYGQPISARQALYPALHVGGGIHDFHGHPAERAQARGAER